MKSKFFLFAIVALALVACNNNEPQEKLIGTWSEQYNIKFTVKSLTFNTNGTLTYVDKPDTTIDNIITWGGDSLDLKYAVKKDNKLYIYGEYPRLPMVGQESKPFAYTTGYTIEGNTLILDSFSYAGDLGGIFYKPLILYKQ